MSIVITKYKLFAYKDGELVARAVTENETQICKLADELRKNGYKVRLYDVRHITYLHRETNI